MSAADLYRRYSNPDVYQAAIEKKNFDGQYTRASVIVTLSIALGLYNSIEMQLLIFTTFKKWKGLYFWSLNLCNWGVVLYSLGMLLMYFEKGPLLFSKIILDIGWLGLVIFQSLVLYSRLNLILENMTFLRVIKWYVIVNSFLLASATVILDFCVTYVPKPESARGYFYIEHIQMTGFTLQEVIISGVYVWQTVKLLRVISKANTRSMIWQLLGINIVIIALDVMLIFFQFKHLQLYQESVKGFVYSVKLKLELNILSKLVDLVHGGNDARSTALATIDSNTLVGQAQTDIKQEMVTHDFVTSWVNSDEKNQTNVKQSTASQGSSDSHGLEANNRTFDSLSSEHDGVARMRSNRSGQSTRLHGREIDTMYADMLRSISYAGK